MLIIAGMGGMEEMGIFYDHCLESLYPPGMCGTYCNQHTYDCFWTDIQSACCDEGGLNCPDGQDIPSTCPVGCAIVFPEFMETCRSHVQEQDALELADYEGFETRCLEQDGLGLVEYAMDMRANGCVLDLSGGESGRRLQEQRPSQGFVSQGVAASPSCRWDEFDDIADDVDQICCGKDGDDCAVSGNGVLAPANCSPACAVAIHSFTVSCAATLVSLSRFVHYICYD
eukprot:COSAG04_NODE_11_length_42922_cov_38.819700_30_plen_228_part_00